MPPSSIPHPPFFLITIKLVLLALLFCNAPRSRTYVTERAFVASKSVLSDTQTKTECGEIRLDQIASLASREEQKREMAKTANGGPQT